MVSNMAASMAFVILNECDKRYAFPYSLLLWHPMRVGGMFASFSADEMEYLIYTLRLR
jgi:ATP-dependent protease ClpP protease subunit